MSEVTLTVLDKTRVISGHVHGSDANRALAALAAEPESIEELDVALGRLTGQQVGHDPCRHDPAQEKHCVDDPCRQDRLSLGRTRGHFFLFRGFDLGDALDFWPVQDDGALETTGTLDPTATMLAATEGLDEPWDAGVVILDLAARLIAGESSYSGIASTGTARLLPCREEIPFRLSDEWLVAPPAEPWQLLAATRRRFPLTPYRPK